MIRRTVSAFALMFVSAAAVSAQAAPAAAPAAPTQAQVSAAIDTMRMEVAAARKQTVALNMNLTSDQATKFWPVYDAYRAEMKKAKDSEWMVVQKYAETQKMMNDSTAQVLMTSWMATRKAQMDLRASYVPKFAAVIPWMQVARYFQIENKLDVMLDYQRTKVIPLVK
jgi:Spy/CpxP family protein refolding chaperone